MNKAVAMASALLGAAVMLAGTHSGRGAGGTITGVETPIVVAPGEQLNPAISGNVVVYTDLSAGNADIYYYDGAIHPVAAGPGDQELAAISGTTIVYNDHTGGAPGEIFAYAIPTGTITNSSNDIDHDQFNPAVSADLSVWEDARFGPPHIGVYDGAAAVKTIMGDFTSAQSQPALSGTNVVYMDDTARPIRLNVSGARIVSCMAPMSFSIPYRRTHYSSCLTRYQY